MLLRDLGWQQLKRCLLLIVGLSLLACQSGEGNEKQSKGVTITMKTYPMGRFSIDMPVTMNQAIQEHRIRSCEINEFHWQQNIDRNQAMKTIWNAHVLEIKKLEPPEGITKIILDERSFPKIGHGAKGVFYYGNRMSIRKGNWDVLMDAGQTGVWFKFSGLLSAKEDMKNWVLDIAKSYQYVVHEKSNPLPQGNWFYLKHGAINLPYLEQEHTYARFEGHPLVLKLEIKMDETQEVEKASLVDSLGKFLVSNVTPGLDIQKIRSQKRKIAELKGEEIILKMTEEGKSTLRFRWQYQGKEDSGDHPEIEINMESPDGNVDAKLKVWDAILDSFKPINQSGK